ncbi:GAF domain-containing protein [Paenibacillus sp. YIM B09110]|uniref:GAF domain-containing protein n=1 Tax=Paenibacillus sp. YIM B09110 TaxID=3126102 RepID=UPI00301E5277
MRNFEADTISRAVHYIRVTSLSDFTALALPIDDGSKYRWQYASGNMNHRYQHMIVKRGKGLPGMALLLGRSLIKDIASKEANKPRFECSLMLAEGLHTAAAVPIPDGFGSAGVLMVGVRHPHSYTDTNLIYLEQCAIELSNLLEISRYKT